MRVTKWGNSLGVRLPKQIVEDMGLRAGDELRVVKTIDGTLAIDIGRRREQAAAERPASLRIRRSRKAKTERV
jgi:antitoxin MazE